MPAIREKCRESEEKTQMLETSLLLEGLPRHASTHAAGVVVADKPLNEYLPLFRGKEGETITQFDMNYVEKLGLVKFDFLGLRNLTVIKNCLELIEKQGKPVPDMDHLDFTDDNTFALLQRADTTGVFQLESSGMKDLILRLKPATFSDIVAWWPFTGQALWTVAWPIPMWKESMAEKRWPICLTNWSRFSKKPMA